MTPKLTSWTGLDVDIGEDGRISLTAPNPERVKAASATVRSCEQRIAVMEKVVAELDRWVRYPGKSVLQIRLQHRLP